MSNDMLIGLTGKGNTWVTIYYKLIVLLKEIVCANVSKIMFRWCLTFDSVYSMKANNLANPSPYDLTIGQVRIEPRREKPCFREFANNKGPNQPAQPRSLNSAFLFAYWKESYQNLLPGKFQISRQSL